MRSEWLSSSTLWCWYWWALLVLNVKLLMAQGVEKNWIKHDFKIVVEAGVMECFYQTVEHDSVFHVSFQVIRGDDVTFYMNDPNRVEVQRSDRQQAGSFQIPKTTGTGDYEVCFDNTYSHMNSKLVSIYILSFHSEALMKKFEHDKELNETAHLAKKASDKISINLIEAFTKQAMARFKQTRDEYILEANNSLVMYWSFFQMLLVCLCALFQVYFIKRLFNTSTTSSSTKSQSR